MQSLFAVERVSPKISIRLIGDIVTNPQGIRWTNKSVLRLAGDEDPIAVIERKAQALALKARDAGWKGPPFDPIMIADLLEIPVEANASVPDARIVLKDRRLTIQYNPTQPRARVRFTIAHELAHTLFPDVADEVIPDYQYAQRPKNNRVAEIAIDHSVPNMAKYVTRVVEMKGADKIRELKI
jgi:hypothetical protein